MGAFAGFAVGFVARPLGGIVFGHIGDRHGRKKALVITLAMMGVATFLIGLLPTFEQAGYLAPLCLVICVWCKVSPREASGVVAC